MLVYFRPQTFVGLRHSASSALWIIRHWLTPLNRVTLVRGHFAPIKRRTQLTENMLY